MAALRLVVLTGIDAGHDYALRGERLTIGVADEAGLALKDPLIAPLHCEITTVPGGERAIVTDLGTAQGTFVNGTQVLRAYLDPGSIVLIGQTQILLEDQRSDSTIRPSDQDHFGELVGRSRAMRLAFATLEQAGRSDATVLMQGETGTGKEAAAESIHRSSRRRHERFVVVDCASVPHDLIEAELFGHERGSFTGAVSARVGAFESGHAGTLFLDEIGELGADLQPKLLRALEKREIKRIGSPSYRAVDVRLIAATHRNLRAEVRAGRFRSDLFYRLGVIEVRLPPLRERLEDIPLLVDRIAEQLAEDRASSAFLRTAGFIRHLMRHAWPGNVRELRNYLERCLVLGCQAPIVPPDGEIPGIKVSCTRPIKAAREEWIRAFERIYLAQLLEQHGHNLSAAARAAGVDRVHFYRLLWRCGLR